MGLTVAAAAAHVEAVRRRVRDAYGGDVGRPVGELVTPALVLDLPAARRNIATMADRLRTMPASLRPHVKVHKSPDLARLQVEAGAVGVCVATVWEALVMAAAGLDDIFVVNTLAGPAQLRSLAHLATERRVLVAVDDAGNAAALDAAARAAGATLGVLIEVDTGMDRAGVDTAAAAVALARALDRLPALHLAGVTGYEGHCALTPERDERARKQAAAMSFLVAVADAIRDDGHPVGVVSAGGTATWDWTATYPGVTEIQAGTYVVMDQFHRAMVGDFEPALTVATTVVSRPPGRLIVDAGSKSVGDPDLSAFRGLDLAVVRFDEEHGVFAAGPTAPGIGQVLELFPGYAPSTVNLFDAYHVVEDGVVVDIWPVVPRGPGHGGLAAPLT